ncbi:hypothetical protein MHK_010264, partial [Candidatus Magnetomorum sp. HK-1]
SIPLTLNNLSYTDIGSIELHIGYDPDVLTATGISLTGTVLENQNYLYEFNVSIPGIIYALFASSTDIYTGTGLLLNLDFTVLGSPGETSDITLSTAIFNNLAATKSDGTFTVAPNSAPTITGVTPQTRDEDTPISFSITLSDNESNPCDLSLTFTSSDETLVSVNSISYTCLSGDYFLSITPSTNQAGNVTLTITATDDSNLASVEFFELTITAVNDAPEITLISDQTTDEDTAISSISLTVTDLEDASCSIALTFGSSNIVLMPVENISYTCSSNEFFMSLTPVSNLSGSTIIAITVTDSGGLTATTSFTLTVTNV